jgi:hypothetical protein
VVKALPQTETIRTQKMHLKRECFFRSPEIDSDPHDQLFEIVKGTAKRVTTSDFHMEIAKYKDPTSQDRLMIFTGRQDLFG